MKDLTISVDDKDLIGRLEEAASKLKPGDIEKAKAFADAVSPIMNMASVAFNDIAIVVADAQAHGVFSPFCAIDYAEQAARLDEQMKAILPPTPWYILVRRWLAMQWGWVMDMVILRWWRS